MSTVAPAPAATPETRPIQGERTSLARVLHSEWIKTRTLRSTWISAAVVLAVIVGLGLLAAWMANDAPAAGAPGGGPGGGATDPVSLVLVGANLALLILAVLGCMVGAASSTPA